MTTMNKEPGEKFFILGKKGQTMELEVPLTAEHLNAIHKQIAEVSADTFRLEEEKKLAVQPFNEKLKDAKARERELLSQKERGVMKVAVPVETRGDTLKREKWVVRMDTGEEVPETRLALTDADLQIAMRGVVIDGDLRPDAPVLSLFAQRQPPESPPERWTKTLPSPYQEWSLTEEKAADGTPLYVVSHQPVDGATQTWGTYAFTAVDGFHPPGEPTGTLGEGAREAMAKALGLSDRAANLDDATPEETNTFELFLTLLEETALTRMTELAVPKEPAPPEGLKLYEAGGHPGWAAYVHGNQLFIRPPNVDRFEGPRSDKDYGPLEWNATETCFDGVKGANVTSAWLTSHEALLADFDFLKKEGTISEPVNELKLGAASPATESPGEHGEEEIGPVLSPGEAAAGAASEEPPDVDALAAKLTDNGRKILNELVKGGPNTAATIGARTRCGKPGAALKHLAKNGMVDVRPPGPGEAGEIWGITDLGRKVQEASAASQK